MAKYPLTIKDWPEDERPRERLIKWGADKLPDTELLAILLRTGNRQYTALDLARQLLQEFDSFRGLNAKSVAELCEVDGVGKAKAAQIKAALEIANRLNFEKSKVRQKIESKEDVQSLVGPYLRDLPREVFKVLLLTSRNNLIVEKTIFEGSLTESLVNPREIIKEALNAAAASIIFVHNHPSGNFQPSQEDKRLTNQLVSACKLVGITVVDHVIIGKDDCFSFSEHGLI